MSKYELKLEVFKITLNHNKEKVTDSNFRDFLKGKFDPKNKNLDDKNLQKKFIEDLSNRLDNKGEYHQIGKNSKKAFSILKTPSYDSKQSFFHGVLKGGFKGDNKTSSDFKDRSSENSLNDKVINNKHFFLFYMPLESNTGFLFFQAYPQENVRLEFVNFLGRYIFKLNRDYNKVFVEPYLPKEIKEEFSNGSTVSQITFTDRVLSSNLSGSNSFTNASSHYRIKVIVEPTGDGNLNLKDFEKKFYKKIISNSALGKKLKKYTAKGKLKKDGRETPFKIGGTDEILPLIQLGDDYLDKNKNPDFKKLKNYCINLIETIKSDFYDKSKTKLID